MRNIHSKPQKAHFSAIPSLQHIPSNITDTREFAGEIVGNKSLGFIELCIFTRFLFYTFRKHERRRYLSEFQLTLLRECLSWVCSERYSKTLLKPVKCLIATSEARLSPPSCMMVFVQMMHESSAKQKGECI